MHTCITYSSYYIYVGWYLLFYRTEWNAGSVKYLFYGTSLLGATEVASLTHIAI